MTRLRPILLLLLSVVSSALARHGVVETREGRFFEGHVRFESNLVVVVDAAKEVRAEVGLTNLAGISMDSDTAVATVVSRADQAEPGGLPRPWQNLDVGSVRREGSAEFKAGMFRV